MGGKNIIIVMDDANLDLAVDGAVWAASAPPASAARGQSHRRSQICLQRIHFAPGRPRKKLKVGNGLDPGIDMGRASTNSNSKRDGVRANRPDRRRQASHRRHRLTDGPHAKGWFHEPTVFGDCNPKMRVAQEESSARWFR